MRGSHQKRQTKNPLPPPPLFFFELKWVFSYFLSLFRRKNWWWRKTPPNHIINATYFLFPLLSFSVWRETEWGGILFSFPSTNEGFGYFSFISFHPRGGENTFEIVKLRPSHSRIGWIVRIFPFFSGRITTVFWAIAVFWVCRHILSCTEIKEWLFWARCQEFFRAMHHFPKTSHGMKEAKKVLVLFSQLGKRSKKCWINKKKTCLMTMYERSSSLLQIHKCRKKPPLSFRPRSALQKKSLVTGQRSGSASLDVEEFPFLREIYVFLPPARFNESFLRERSKSGSCCSLFLT